jgi:hypothetical protein
MEWVEKEFSSENFLSLGRACFEIGKKIEEMFYSNGYDTLILPSRGAIPLFTIAILINCYIANQENREIKLKNIAIPSILKNTQVLKVFR